MQYIKSRLLSQLKTIFFILSLLTLASSLAHAGTSKLCDELARFTCAPGEFDDGTGSVKSSAETKEKLDQLLAKYKTEFSNRFAKTIKDPEEAYFRELSMSALGLKNSPTCNSKLPTDIELCNKNIIDGLTSLAQKQTFGSLMPAGFQLRYGPIQELQFIMQNDVYNGIVGDLNTKAKAEIENKEQNKKIEEEIYPQIRDLIIGKLNQLPIDESQKKLMIDKIKSINFKGTNCSEFEGGHGGTAGSGSISTALLPNAFYNPMSNIFKYCSGFVLQSDSAFQMASVIAHELSHSIDPCSIALGPADRAFQYKNTTELAFMENEYPIKNLLQCLRSSQSVGASRMAIASANPIGGGFNGGSYSNPRTEESGEESKVTRAESQLAPELSFCMGDQIGESFADWMAAEVTPLYIEKNYKLTDDQYKNGYANIFRTSCAVGEVSMHRDFDPHPKLEDRVNKIILVNPKVRQHMGCSGEHSTGVYCEPFKTVAIPTTSRIFTRPEKAAPKPYKEGAK